MFLECYLHILGLLYLWENALYYLYITKLVFNYNNQYLLSLRHIVTNYSSYNFNNV